MVIAEPVEQKEYTEPIGAEPHYDKDNDKCGQIQKLPPISRGQDCAIFHFVALRPFLADSCRAAAHPKADIITRKSLRHRERWLPFAKLRPEVVACRCSCKSRPQL
jgi:hypothetical protein